VPNPVSFNVTAGAVPENFEGGLQATLNMFAERLIIAPSVPWSSFVLGPAQPSSNVGPWFKDGQELRVWSDTLGTYIPVKVNGTGIIPGTLPLSAFEQLTPQQVLISDIDGNVSIVGGTPGQVLTVAPSGTPVFKDAPTGQYFAAITSADQPYVSDGLSKVVLFNTAFGQQAANFDATAWKFDIDSNSAGIWFFYASVLIADINSPSTNVTHTLSITRNDGLNGLQSSTTSYIQAVPTNGLVVSGIFDASAGDYFKVTINSTSNNLTGNEFQVVYNGALTRFGGFKLA
jgi:hypothetical protein